MDKRFFLALFLSLVVIAISHLLFPPPKPVTPPPARATVTIDSAKKDADLVGKGTTPSAVSAQATLQSTQQAPAKAATDSLQKTPVGEVTTVISPRATYSFNSIGAALTSTVIKDYANRAPGGGRVVLAVPGGSLLSYQIVSASDTTSLGQTPFTLVRSRSRDSDVLTYSATVESMAVTIAYVIPADTLASYSIHVTGTVSGLPTGQAYLLTALPKTLPSAEADTVADHRSLAYSFKPHRDHSASVLFGSLDPGEKRLETGPLDWIAVKNKYFVVGVLAPEKGSQLSEATLVGGPRTSKVATSASATVVEEIRDGAFSFDVYAGPQESQRLIRMGRDFDHVNPYGWRFLQSVVHPIASEVIRALLWMHKSLRLSYGWVLVILGVLIRLALWPLNQSTMRSSLKMQELQPKLAAAQKKYKDPVQQREAIMKVYHDAGVSPFAGLTGCLPALLPMPILFALFFVFQNTIEFRGVPFLWLSDISIKDPLYILPLLMGASMYVLSWIGMRNAPPNPQAKMMGYMFPVMMTVVLLNMASGLNLYYTAQNIAALPQQWLLARERAKARPAG